MNFELYIMNWYSRLGKLEKLQSNNLKGCFFQYVFTICKFNLSRNRHSGLISESKKLHDVMLNQVQHDGIAFETNIDIKN
jgi:hypothetical protein